MTEMRVLPSGSVPTARDDARGETGSILGRLPAHITKPRCLASASCTAGARAERSGSLAARPSPTRDEAIPAKLW
jgi:hypothetical protein